MSTLAFYLVLAAISGALGAIHVPINGALGLRIQSTLAATLLFYGVAFATTALLVFATGERTALRGLGEIPAWYWIVPGLISVAVVASGTFLMPRLGAVNVFVVTVTAQALVRLVISHFGWLESPVDPIGATKLVGAGFVVLGAFLVVRT